MTHLLKKVAMTIAASSLCLSLVACHSNPLMSDESIEKIKKGMWWVYGVGDAGLCSHYYANPSSDAALKARCDVWLNQIYKRFINDGTISYKATLEDFKDPALWQILKQK